MSFLLINCTSKSKKIKVKREDKTIEREFNHSNTIAKAASTYNIFFQPSSTTNQIINHNYFTLSYSEKDEQAEWVSYKVSSNNFTNKIRRTNNFKEDPLINTESASTLDYKRSGYDRGHLAPANAMKFNSSSMSDSFYMSNISPQKPSFNRGIWRTLEGKVEYWASFKDSIYVVTGPILDNPIDQIGKNKVNVPRAFYKTLLGFKNGNVEGLAFILPNEKSNKPIYTFATSIDEVERITKIDFYKNLDAVVQDKVEANRALKKWIFIK